LSSTLPPGDQPGPEYLEQGSGRPLRPRRRPVPGVRRKPLLIAGGVVASLALVGGAVWAASSMLGTGAQPAEALPAGTLGYASIDLDPSASQKVEAFKMLRKFPAIKEQLGLEPGDDLRKKLFEEIQGGDLCPGLHYADDIEPWLGDRAAVAAVDTGAKQPAPVVVVQVKDEARADDGLEKIRACASGTDGAPEPFGWKIADGWAVLGESDDVAATVSQDAAAGSLADDSDFQHWTDAVGDTGIVNLYAAPAAGAYLADNLGGLGMFGSSGSTMACSASSSDATETCNDIEPAASGGNDDQAPGELRDTLRDFKGMAATIRFDGGAVELEFAGDPGAKQQALFGTDRGDDVVSTLPADTAAALGVGFDEGWFSSLIDQMASSGGEQSPAELMASLAKESGLDLPADAETLAGDSLAVSVGSDIDPEAIFNSADGSDLPVAVTVHGNSDAIEGVLDKIRRQLGTGQELVGTDTDGELIAVGPNADYRAKVLANGGLGDTDAFKSVVPNAADASGLLFVNFDAGDWLVNLAGGDQQLVDNLQPLEGLGVSSWHEDDAAHALVRLTTN
jgi:uncharacterized protein DUF3352